MLFLQKIIIIVNFEQRLNAFTRLGDFINQTLQNQSINDEMCALRKIIEDEHLYNPWFIKPFVEFSLSEIARITKADSLKKHLQKYDFSTSNFSEIIAVIMAGNIPLVGFLDFFDVLICDKNFIGKLSSQDKHLLPFLAKILCQIEPEFNSKICFSEQKLEHFDKIIATGSNHSASLFQQYFKNKPHIIRHHRNSIAILTGMETDEELSLLADDICLYFGLGCRNVSKIYIPQDYDFTKLIDCLKKYESIFMNHTPYTNNLTYLKSIFYINKINFIDAGCMILKKETSLKSYISCLCYEYYSNITDVFNNVKNSENIQCIIACKNLVEESVNFGKSQCPDILDFADHIDTLNFCLN